MLPVTECCVACSVFGPEVHLFYALGSINFLAFSILFVQWLNNCICT